MTDKGWSCPLIANKNALVRNYFTIFINFYTKGQLKVIWTFFGKSLQNFPRNLVLASSHILPCRKRGQGIPKVTIWTILVRLKYPMPPIKFQGHRSIGSREKNIVMLAMWPGQLNNSCLLSPIRLNIKFDYNRPSGFWGEIRNCHTKRVLGQKSRTDLVKRTEYTSF